MVLCSFVFGMAASPSGSRGAIRVWKRTKVDTEAEGEAAPLFLCIN